MNTDYLRTLITLKETGSFRKAADLLYLTPPAVKHALDSLEAETNLTLFNRSHTGLAITESGTVLAEYAEKILELLNEGTSFATEAAAENHQIIDAPWMPNPVKDTTYTAAFAAFQKAHPEIDVDFRMVKNFVGEHYDAINGYVDVAHTHAVPHFLSFIPVCCVVASNHPFASRSSIACDELAPYDLLIPNRKLVALMDDRTQEFIASHRGKIAYLENDYHESELYQWCVKKQRAAIAIGMWPRKNDSLSLDSIPLEGATFKNCMYTQKNPTSAVVTFVEFMQRFYQESQSQ